MSVGQLRMAKARLHQQRPRRRWPLRNRWLVVKARTREDWHEWWADLVYLIVGC
jgi:hypothetical protein